MNGDEGLAFQIPSKSHFYIINGFQLFNTVTFVSNSTRSLISAKVLFKNRVY